VSLQKKTFSQIKSQNAESYDGFFQFKQDDYPFSDGLLLNNVMGLSSINDSTINNYSFLFLTDKLKDSDIYSFDTKQVVVSNVVGTIQFNGGFLYFDDPSTLGVLPFTVYNEVYTPGWNSVTVQPSSNIIDVNNSYFEIVIIDSLYCKIRHCVDDSIFYLAYEPGVFDDHDFFFTKTPSTFCISPSGVDNTTFYCLYDQDDGYLSLYKPLTSVSGVVVYEVTSESSNLTLTSVATGSFINSNLLKVQVVNSVDPKINTSWVSYNIDNIEDGHINDTKSRFNIKGNHLLTFEYSNDPAIKKFRDLKLKNIFTDTNTINRGAVFDNPVPEVPSVNHREYTTITTGNDDETGYPHITLNYIMFSKDIYVAPGEVTLFQTSSSLYPYEQLNINDSTFAVNGSFGGSTPSISDRIVSADKMTSEYKGGRYLTTWLSAGDINTKGVWVDRYYIPDLTTKQQAFSALPVYAPTFSDDIEKLLSNNAEYTANILKSPIFDKKSDVVLAPNKWYEYHRIGNTDITTYNSEIEGLAIDGISKTNTFNGITTYDTPLTTLELTGNVFASIPSSTINKYNSFTLKFDYNIDWKTNDFYQLIGNTYQYGFGIFKNYKITPFIYIIDGNKLKVYNSDLNFLFETILIGALSPITIKTVIISKYLKDLIIIDNEGSIYRVSTGGVLKQYLITTLAAGYVGWTQDDDTAYFLYADGTAVCLNLTTLEVGAYEVTPFTPDEALQSLTIYDDIVYGIAGECIKYDTTYGYVSGGNEIFRYNFRDKTKETFISSLSSNTLCTIDDEQCVYVVNTNNLVKLTKNRRLIASARIDSLSSSPIRIDTISEFDETGELNTEILYVSKSNVDNTINITKYNKDLVEIMNLTADVSYIDYNNYVLSNYNLFDHGSSSDTIRISIALVNLYDRKDIVTEYIDINTSDLSNNGTFILRCDTNQGNFTIFNNYQKLGNITFDPAKYRLDDLFYDDIFIGTAGMVNNTSLMAVINQKNHYTINDATISNVKLYNVPLKDYEVQSLLLESRKIQDLTLTLPCGQRNNIEEIRRMFFFQPPTSKSTDIDVIVKNSSITSTEFQASIKDKILINIKKYLPGNVNINDIKFEYYKDE